MLSAVLERAVAVAEPRDLCTSLPLQTQIKSLSEIKSSVNRPFKDIIAAMYIKQLCNIFKNCIHELCWLSIFQLIYTTNKDKSHF